MSKKTILEIIFIYIKYNIASNQGSVVELVIKLLI